MKETYSMEEVIFMYSKATVNKAEWENKTYETVWRDEVRSEYKRIMFLLKKIVFMLTASEECVEIFQNKNLMLNSKEVKNIAGLLYQYETNGIWRDIEKLLPLYDIEAENDKNNKERRPKGTEWRMAIKKMYGLDSVMKKTWEDMVNEIYEFLETNSAKKGDNGIWIEKSRKIPFDEMYNEICTAADLLENVLSHRVKNVKELIDSTTGRELSFVKGIWNIK